MSTITRPALEVTTSFHLSLYKNIHSLILTQLRLQQAHGPNERVARHNQATGQLLNSKLPHDIATGITTMTPLTLLHMISTKSHPIALLRWLPPHQKLVEYCACACSGRGGEGRAEGMLGCKRMLNVYNPTPCSATSLASDLESNPNPTRAP